MLKIIWIELILVMSVILAPVASAEIYTWEDADSLHFTDNPSSIPDKYGEIERTENKEQINNLAPHVTVEVTKQNNPVSIQKEQTRDIQADPEQQRQATITFKQQQTRAIPERIINVKDTFPSLATLVVVGLIITLFLIITWIATIVDTVRSKFITPSIRTGWILMVLFIPFIGMLFYYILGLSQKCNTTSYNDKQQLETIA